MTETSPELDTEHVVEPAQPRSRRTTVLVVLVALLLVVDAVLAAFWLVDRKHDNDLDAARADSVAAARQEIVNLDSLSATTIDRDLAAVLSGATGTFRDQFRRSQDDLKGLIKQHRTASSAKVLSAAVVRVDASSATVLVATDRTVRDATTPGGQVVNERWKVDLEKHGGRWLVADLQPVS